tara:strand:- start:3 stop:131 length:129 start_codon:yes stop_codon:yes gene_type:complete
VITKIVLVKIAQTKNVYAKIKKIVVANLSLIVVVATTKIILI